MKNVIILFDQKIYSLKLANKAKIDSRIYTENNIIFESKFTQIYFAFFQLFEEIITTTNKLPSNKHHWNSTPIVLT